MTCGFTEASGAGASSTASGLRSAGVVSTAGASLTGVAGASLTGVAGASGHLRGFRGELGLFADFQFALVCRFGAGPVSSLRRPPRRPRRLRRLRSAPASPSVLGAASWLRQPELLMQWSRHWPLSPVPRWPQCLLSSVGFGSLIVAIAALAAFGTFTAFAVAPRSARSPRSWPLAALRTLRALFGLHVRRVDAGASRALSRLGFVPVSRLLSRASRCARWRSPRSSR